MTISEDPAPIFRSVTSSHEQLFRVLPGHNTKEEQVLYPMTGRALGGAWSEALTSRLQAEQAPPSMEAGERP